MVFDQGRKASERNKLLSVLLFSLTYVLPVVLPVAAAGAGFAAAGKHGLIRAAWITVAVASVFANGVISARKEKKAITVREAAISAKTELATTLTEAGEPLVVALSKICASPDPAEAQNALAVLTATSVGIAQEQCGHSSGKRCRTRSTFYRWDQHRLVRDHTKGRNDGEPARPAFDPAVGIGHRAAIATAQGEKVLWIKDLNVDATGDYVDLRDKPYRSLIAAPVRSASGSSFGLLTVDSDVPHSLTVVDVRYMTLVAGILAAGFAEIATRAQFGRTNGTVPSHVATPSATGETGAHDSLDSARSGNSDDISRGAT
jgi:hypothetical protein